MKRRFPFLALLGICISLSSSSAQDRIAEKRPTIEVRMRSIDDLVGKIEYIGTLIGKPDEAAQVAQVIQAFKNKNGLEGIDTKREWGFYAQLTPAMIDSPAILMIPIADETTFLNLLRGRLSLNPEKDDDGIYSMDIPNVPVPVFFKFADSYLYATIANNANLNNKKIIPAKTFLVNKLEPLMSASVNFSAIPESVRNTFLGQVEMQLAQEKSKKGNQESPFEAKIKVFTIDRMFSAIQTLANESDSMTLSLNLDSTTDNVSADLVVTPTTGKPFASTLQGLSKKASRTNGYAVAKNPLGAVSINLEMSDEQKKAFAPLAELMVADAIANADENAKPMVKKLMTALQPTLKAGRLDTGMALTGTSEDGLSLVGGLAIVGGDGVVEAIQDIVKEIPPVAEMFKFNVKEIDGSSLHEVAIPVPELTELYKSDKGWLLTSNERLGFAITPEATTLTKIKAETSSQQPLLSAEVATARVVMLTDKKAPQNLLAKMMKEVFPDGSIGKDTITLKVEAAKTLNIRLIAKGSTLRMFSELDRLHKAN